LGLPGHGENRDFITESSDQSLERALKVIYQNIDGVCPNQDLVIIAYSIGSLLVIKLLEKLFKRNHDLKLILIGSALRIREESSTLIKQFFNESMYKRLGWEPVMKKQHGETWIKTVELIDEWMLPESGIAPTKPEIQIILEKIDKIVFIIGNKDQPFNASDILEFGPFKVNIVSGDHFSYFLVKKAWPETKEIIDETFINWGISTGSLNE
ncbi:MAG: hypothetical protein ACC656_06765, partial [Candidatus Heimdallarchaeota archaeon]